MILLVGPPGAGKSTFCQQAALNSLTLERPIIFVTTECGPSDVEKVLSERGLGEIEPGLLNFVDAYSETVGVSPVDRSDTIHADSADLSSVGIAISKLQERIGKKGILLLFDSLVSPYLLTGAEVTRFIRLTLSRFVAQGNSVLACMDEGCSKQEDLGAMMSLSNGVIKMGIEEGRKILNVVKYPKVEPTTLDVPTDKAWERKLWDVKTWDREYIRRYYDQERSGAMSKDVEKLAVNIFWPSVARWNTVLWDPKRFPMMMYEFVIRFGASFRDMIPMLPLHIRLLLKMSMPKSLSKTKDMKKIIRFLKQMYEPRGMGIIEYADDVSRTDEHYVRLHESFDCSGFENVGVATSLICAPLLAGMCKAFEKEERDWNAIETKCVGLGDPYCEIKLVPGKIDELKDSLQKDVSAIERIHERLTQRLMGFFLHGKPPTERTRLGADLAYSPETSFAIMAGEGWRMAYRMGGARAGKMVGERLMEAGVTGDEAVKAMINFLEHCKVGEVTVDETITIRENVEVNWAPLFYTEKFEEPCCFFTTGFLNGFFSAVKNQHVKETKCIAMGDSYCEWEFR